MADLLFDGGYYRVEAEAGADYVEAGGGRHGVDGLNGGWRELRDLTQ